MIIYIVIAVVAVLAIVLAAGGTYFYNVAILRRRKEFLENDQDLSNGTSGSYKESKQWIINQNSEKIKLLSEDGLKLNARYIGGKNEGNINVILVHGYSSYGLEMAEYARYYNEELGYNILVPDLRGHGESQGNYIGFGWHDRKDIIKWINYLIERNGEDAQIILHGVSMGAGTVLMTSGEELNKNVKFIVADCSYTSAKAILKYQLKRMYRLPSFPIIQITSLMSKFRARYFFGEASALNQVKKSKVPILFIHGDSDRFVPTDMVHELYEAAACEKKLLIIKGAAHANAFWKDSEGYKKQVGNFINDYIL
ncbi:alpha/beta hydrolase [Clostridium sp. 19966]|uniref:alpha/beta hydrolase n=1 Tax=Clostridium sp. 19966 TaxID=2768166 RepID=UPI0028DFDC43|nr:alpha/beta hydrolase [Clostridium sp. 19966]MDT8716777.1 alpha/beta hydrolase [Clostridium sp. 19966]